MTSTTGTLRSTVDRALANPFPDLWQNAAEITLFAVDAYTEGLSALVEQQLHQLGPAHGRALPSTERSYMDEPTISHEFTEAETPQVFFANSTSAGERG